MSQNGDFFGLKNDFFYERQGKKVLIWGGGWDDQHAKYIPLYNTENE